jgi:hypothetical protein
MGLLAIEQFSQRPDVRVKATGALPDRCVDASRQDAPIARMTSAFFSGKTSAGPETHLIQPTRTFL